VGLFYNAPEPTRGGYLGTAMYKSVKHISVCLQCFDAVGLAAGKASRPVKTERRGAVVVICLERGAVS